MFVKILHKRADFIQARTEGGAFMTEKKSISHFFKPGIVLVLGIWMLLGIQTTVYAEESGDDGAVVALDGTEQKQTK